MPDPQTRNRTPFELGAWDAYYGRTRTEGPAKEVNGERVTNLTHAERVEYWRGVLSEDDRKDWG